MAARGSAKDFGAFLDRTVGSVGYLIGTRGQLCTTKLIAEKRAAYPAYAAKIDACAAKWLGRPVADCMGWCEMWENGGDVGQPVSTFIYPDRRTQGDYALAQQLGLPNGPIGTLPKDGPDEPLAVGYEGHVGYWYRGMVYQSAGHCSGTIITALKYVVPGLKPWEYWYRMPYLTYGEETIQMQYGDNGPEVLAWQNALLETGNWPMVDGKPEPNGNFGPATKANTNEFKKKNGLPEDGIVDELTYGKMLDTLRAKGDATEAELAKTQETLRLIKIDNLALESLNMKLEADNQAGKDGINGLIAWASK